MKRFMYILLTVMLFGVVFLSACGDDNSGTDEQNKSNNEETDNQEENAATESDENATDENASEQTEEATEDDNQETDDSSAQPEIVLENEAFRIYEPTPDAVVGNQFTVRGEAKVFEASFRYEFEDGHNILDEGNVVASTAAPDWGEFEITIAFDEVAYDTGTVILYDESQKDGSRQYELFIPVKIEK